MLRAFCFAVERACRAMFLLGFVIGVSPAAHAAGVPLLSPAASAPSTALGKYRLTQIQGDAAAQHISFVDINQNALAANIIVVNPGDVAPCEYVGKQSNPIQGDPTVTWLGTASDGASRLSLAMANGAIDGTFECNRESYLIRSLENGVHVLVHIDRKKRVPPNDNRPSTSKAIILPPLGAPVGKAHHQTALATAAATSPTVRILFAYTDLAAADQNISTVPAKVVSAMNSILAGGVISGSVVSAGLVHSSYKEQPPFADLDSLLGVMKDPAVLMARDQNSADIIMIVTHINPNDSCGRALRTYARTPSEAFAVITSYGASCGDVGLFAAHEMGHILGADHPAAYSTGTSPYAAAHGYNGEKNSAGSNVCVHTVMSYYADYDSGLPACGADYAISLYSNPNQQWIAPSNNSIPVVFTIGSSSQNNAGVVAAEFPRVANFHQTPFAISSIKSLQQAWLYLMNQ